MFYRAVVVDNQDPTSSSRVRLKIPQLFGDEVTTWADPLDLNLHTVLVPAVGESVWASFEGNDMVHPVYLPSLSLAYLAATRGS